MIRTGILYVLADICMDIVFSAIEVACAPLPSRYVESSSPLGLVVGRRYTFYCTCGDEPSICSGVYRGVDELLGEVILLIDEDAGISWEKFGIAAFRRRILWSDVIGYSDWVD